MRKDMARVIVERPRIIEDFSRKGRTQEPEELPKQIGLRRGQRERGGFKLLNENLAPLRRYLERQVGRPWDKVYSEISAGLRVTSTVQQHVRDHVKDFVAVRPRRGIRSIYSAFQAKGGRLALWHQPLYVDPEDGILKRTDRLPEEKARRRKEAARKHQLPPAERVAIAPDRELRLINGLWYELTLARMPKAQYRAMTEMRKTPLKPWTRNSRTVETEVTVRRLISAVVVDAASGRRIPVGPEIDDTRSWQEFRRKYPDGRYAVSKRQLSTRELRRHGITNEQG
jgi:hypothetical protein